MRLSRLPKPILALLLLAAPLACTAAPPVEAPPPAAPPAAPASAPPPAPAKPPPRADATLIPRAVLFGNPDRLAPRVSPDGKRIAFLAPDQGVLNLWVGPIDDPDAARPVTRDRERGVRRYFWPYTGDHILYAQDKGGDENWHVFAVELKSGEIKDLTPFEGVAARVEGVSPKVPGEVLIGMNDRDRKLHDLYRVDIRTGARKLVRRNDGFAELVSDDDFKPRLGLRMTPDGGSEYLDLTGKEPKPFVLFGLEDNGVSDSVGFDANGKTLYFLDSRGRDTAALVTLDLATARPTIVGEDPKADIQMFITHPRTGKIQAVASAYERRRWQVIDRVIQPDLDLLRTVAQGDIEVLSRSLDDSRWTVAYVMSDGPVRFYRYDRAKKMVDFLFTSQRSLESLKLARMHPVVIKSRDGLDLVSYLTLPPAADPDGDGKPAAPLPTVLLVHGGPWARDQWGLNPMHQWLASRGYAVLSVNYRGSTGFGKKFVNASTKEWAARMHDDLLDAVSWAAGARIADPQKTAIMGGSYGGYATLVGLTLTPDRFACGVDIVGPSNLITLLNSIPPYWQPQLEVFAKRIGDPRTEDGKKILLDRSPITRVDRIQRPLLIGQGANDPRVKQAESDQIVKAMKEKGIPVTYVLYPDEGHGFARPENRMSFNAVAETFLAQCLGGPYQPIGDDFKGSTITVPAGADAIHDLPAALPKK